MNVILASGSPRRLDLMRAIGVEPRVVVPDVDESLRPAEGAIDYVRRVVAAKLEAVRSNLGSAAVGTLVVAADTTVEVEGMILAKPTDDADAVAMLGRLSGREHCVHTGLAVAAAVPGCRSTDWEGHVEVVSARVWFRSLSTAEIEAYVATGEPLDKAGAYAIQGGAKDFVDRIEGEVSGIIGLPLERLTDIAAGLGVRLSR
ncbi:MAG: Maf family protein [Actinomycetota bacterium]